MVISVVLSLNNSSYMATVHMKGKVERNHCSHGKLGPVCANEGKPPRFTQCNEQEIQETLS